MVKRYAAMVAVLFVVLALVWGWMFWEKSQRDQADAFARPLQEHPLPAGMSLVVADADKGEDGSTIGALLLRGTADEESLLARAAVPETGYTQELDYRRWLEAYQEQNPHVSAEPVYDGEGALLWPGAPGEIDGFCHVEAGEALLYLGSSTIDSDIRAKQEQIDAAQEALDSAQEGVSNFNAVAPIDGVVFSCALEPGKEVK